MNIEEIEYGEGSKVKVDYFPKMCQHCEDPACAKGAPEGAVYKRGDGIVIIDPVKAKGAKGIVGSCPYGAIYWSEAKSLPQKCTLCAHMIDEGEHTVRCAECCPTGALVFGDLDDPYSEASRALRDKAELVEVWAPENGTKPGCRYIDMPKPFIAGEAAYEDEPGEPAKGVSVTLTDESGKESLCAADCFGDFEFKKLEKGRKYTIRIEAAGYQTVTREVDLNKSVNLRTIVLSPCVGV